MNVQQTIIWGIRELLYTHNYLVLPGFGGFVLKSMPAHFGSSGTQLFPASKTVSFNAQLRQNDGILALWLQEKLNCSGPEALQHLQDFTGFCSGILTARRRLSLDRIGFFYLDFENNTCFEPQADTNFLTESFGLGAVSLRELEQPLAEPKREPVFNDRVVTAVPETAVPQPRRNYRRVVIPALVAFAFFSLLALFVANNRFSGPLYASAYSGSTPGSYHSLAYTDLSLSASKPTIQAYVADANGIATLELGSELQLAVCVEAMPHPAVKTPALHAKKSPGHYEIVLGCFTVFQNAQRMAAGLENKQVNAHVSDKNEKGMYVVSDGSFATREEAVKRLKVLKDQFPNAWIGKN